MEGTARVKTMCTGSSQSKVALLLPGQGARWRGPVLAERSERPWYADTGPGKPRLTLSLPNYKLSFHGQRVQREGSAESLCQSSYWPGGIHLINLVSFVLGTNAHAPLCTKVCVHRRACVCAHMRTTALHDEDGLHSGSFQTTVPSILRHFDFSSISCIWANCTFQLWKHTGKVASGA